MIPITPTDSLKTMQTKLSLSNGLYAVRYSPQINRAQLYASIAHDLKKLEEEVYAQ